MKKTEKLAVNGMLLSTSMLWGSAYSYRKIALLYMGSFFFNAWRFFLAFLILVVAYIIADAFRRWRGEESSYAPVRWQIEKGFIIGIVLSFGVNVQQLGLITSDAGKCGFITSLYIFFTPMLAKLIFKKQIPVKIWFGASIAVAGLFCISWGSDFKIVVGDALFVATALFYAMHLILLGMWCGKSSPILLVCVQALTCCVMSAGLSLVFESGNSMENLMSAIWPVIYTGVFTIALSNIIHAAAQKKVSPSLAAIILSFESVFGALFAALIIGERMNSPQIMGCGLIFLAIISSQLEKKAKNC